MTSPVFKSPIPLNYLDTDTALTANSDVKVPTQKAVKAYADTKQSALTKASGAEVDTGTDDAKYVTPKAMEDSTYAKTTAIPVKATGAEVDTGTDDAKFVTAKAMEDSTYAKTTAIPVKASGAEITTGTDDAKFLTAKALADAVGAKIGADWVSFTPSWGGLTMGNGTNYGRYLKIGKLIVGHASFTMGSTSTMGAITLALPETQSTEYTAYSPIGWVTFATSGGVLRNGRIYNTSGYISVDTVSGSYIVHTTPSATIPHTWATGDIIKVDFIYVAD